MKKVLIPALILATGGLIFGFYKHFQRQATLAMDFCYTIKGFKIIEISKKRIALQIDLWFKNKSKLDLKIMGYDFDIFINNQKVTKVVSNEKQTLAGESFSVLSFTIDFDPNTKWDSKELLTILAYAISDKSKVVIRTTGYVSAGINFVKIENLPITIDYTLAELLKPSDPNEVKEKCV